MSMLQSTQSLPWYHSDYLLPASVQSLLTEPEVAMLEYICRCQFSGAGAIVDVGSFLGGSTVAIVDGLLQNPCFDPQKHRVQSYDLFQLLQPLQAYGAWADQLGEGYSFLKDFEQNLGDRLPRVDVHAGDLLQEVWNDGPIEIAFIDVAKSPELNSHVIQQFFPSLIPGKSILIQQDLQYPGCPWLAVCMYVLRDYFSVVDTLPCNSVVYRLEKAIPQEMLEQADCVRMERERIRILHREALRELPTRAKSMLTLDEAAWLQEDGKSEDAINLLVDTLEKAKGDAEGYAVIRTAATGYLPDLFCPRESLEDTGSLDDQRMDLITFMTKDDRELISTLLRSQRPRRVVEIGASGGGSTYLIAKAVRGKRTAKFVTIDRGRQPAYRISDLLRERLSADVKFINQDDGSGFEEASKRVAGKFDAVVFTQVNSYEHLEDELRELRPSLGRGCCIYIHAPDGYLPSDLFTRLKIDLDLVDHGCFSIEDGTPTSSTFGSWRVLVLEHQTPPLLRAIAGCFGATKQAPLAGS